MLQTRDGKARGGGGLVLDGARMVGEPPPDKPASSRHYEDGLPRCRSSLELPKAPAWFPVSCFVSVACSSDPSPDEFTNRRV